jgi:putative sterol carrier protein
MLNVGEFLHNLPHRVNPDAIEGQSSVFHFNINDEGVYTVRLDDGKLEVTDGLHGDPECIVTSTAETFSKVLTGDLNPMMAMMTGKLKISNPGVMLKYAKIFGLM